METRKQVIELNIDDVLPNRFQPRIKFNEEAINELSKSIKEHGVIQPIVVRPIGDKFEIIAGERRYKASRMAGKTTIPAIITDLNDKDSAEVALIENVQRENLTPIEEAISYKKILDMGYITQDALATKLGKTQSTVANKLRLLNLDDDVQEALLNEQISERHARSLLKLTNKNDQKTMLERIKKERLTVRRADEEIEKMLSGNNTIEQNETKNEPQEENKNLFEGFKFINEQENKEEQPKEEQKEELELETKKFFNILEEETKNEEKEPKKIDFDNLFINNPNNMQEHNPLLDEINEIENSINNSNNKNIFETPLQEEITKNEQEEQPKEALPEENNDEFDDDLEFIEEDIDSIELEEPTTINEEKENDQIIIPKRINNIKDVIEEIRTCSNKIENSGFEVDTEEIDLDGEYQVIFKIKKNN
jgi:ParB family chromosome partitioning protein